MYRYERKFVTNKIDEVISVDRFLLNNPVVQFQKLYPSRYIHNIYFDDYSDTSLYENIDGNLTKRKIRLRWYNDNVRNCRLEIKGKIGDNGTKKVWEIYLPQMDIKGLTESLHNYYKFIEIIKTANITPNDDITSFLCFFRPKSYNQYFRNYLSDSTRRLRVTIDKNLLFYNWRASDFGYMHNDPNKIVYEFKYSALDKVSGKLFEKLINNFPLRTSKFSKFANSSYLLYEL